MSPKTQHTEQSAVTCTHTHKHAPEYCKMKAHVHTQQSIVTRRHTHTVDYCDMHTHKYAHLSECCNKHTHTNTVEYCNIPKSPCTAKVFLSRSLCNNNFRQTFNTQLSAPGECPAVFMIGNKVGGNMGIRMEESSGTYVSNVLVIRAMTVGCLWQREERV